MLRRPCFGWILHVVIFPTKLVSSNSEFGCSSYHSFHTRLFGCFPRFSVRIRLGEMWEAFYSWVLGTLEGLVVLQVSGVTWGLQLSCGDCLKLEAFCGITWEPPIKLWGLPQACTGSVTALKGPIVDRGLPFWWEGSRRIRWAIVAFGEPCASTPLQRRVALARVWTSGYIIVSACLGYSYTRALYLCTLLCDSFCVWSYISCYHIVDYLV